MSKYNYRAIMSYMIYSSIMILMLEYGYSLVQSFAATTLIKFIAATIYMMWSDEFNKEEMVADVIAALILSLFSVGDLAICYFGYTLIGLWAIPLATILEWALLEIFLRTKTTDSDEETQKEDEDDETYRMVVHAPDIPCEDDGSGADGDEFQLPTEDDWDES